MKRPPYLSFVNNQGNWELRAGTALGGNAGMPEINDFEISNAMDNAMGNAERLTMTIKSSSTHTLWSDISVLHSTKPATGLGLSGQMDFDWLFSKHLNEPDLARATAPLRLNTLLEAQARLIGLSGEIEIIQKDEG